MELTRQPKKIPVYLHIPKNAGTYMQRVLFRYFVRVVEKTGYIRRITVEHDSMNLTMFCNFKTDYWKTDPHMKGHPFHVSRNVNNTRTGWCALGTFLTYSMNDQFDILSCVAEPVGNNDIRDSLFTIYEILASKDCTPVNFTIMRDVFPRQQSLYHYLRGDESSHEPTHNTFSHETFMQHIMSDQLEDSWLIRALTGTQYGQLNNSLYHQACSFLDANDFIINDIKNTDSILNQVVVKCFGQEIEDSDRERPYYNSTKIENKITIQDLDEETKQRFIQYTYWDSKIYETYIK